MQTLNSLDYNIAFSIERRCDWLLNPRGGLSAKNHLECCVASMYTLISNIAIPLRPILKYSGDIVLLARAYFLDALRLRISIVKRIQREW